MCVCSLQTVMVFAKVCFFQINAACYCTKIFGHSKKTWALLKCMSSAIALLC